jgi:triacylglycerol lipase
LIARLQRMLILMALCSASGWAVYCVQTDRVAAAPILAFGLVALYAGVIAVEFALLALTASRTATARRALPTRYLHAFVGELRASTRVFLWMQPFRAAKWPDLVPPTTGGQRGVVLVHGYFCNRGFWNDWLRRLHEQQVPFVAVTLEPIFGSISDSAPAIDAAVQRLSAATGFAPVIVAHSMGGLVARQWWTEKAAGSGVSSVTRVHHLITLGTPHAGTWLATLGMTTNARQMRIQSPWLQDLLTREPPEHRARTTCYFSSCDNIVFPAEHATLAGARNVGLDGVAHVALANHPEPYAELLRQLEREA